MNGSLDGMGLRLVARLANQLAGALSVDAAQKRFTVAFPRARRLAIATKGGTIRVHVDPRPPPQVDNGLSLQITGPCSGTSSGLSTLG
jgi:hypothetical protein